LSAAEGDDNEDDSDDDDLEKKIKWFFQRIENQSDNPCSSDLSRQHV